MNRPALLLVVVLLGCGGRVELAPDAEVVEPEADAQEDISVEASTVDTGVEEVRIEDSSHVDAGDCGAKGQACCPPTIPPCDLGLYCDPASTCQVPGTVSCGEANAPCGAIADGATCCAPLSCHVEDAGPPGGYCAP